ncbi:MAG: Ig-like domain-containing protein, partial [Candidatus Aminicenantes bacterium]|nr:Ig-like domain-containing protein [Candidatus Aminicenantes bacterium]
NPKTLSFSPDDPFPYASKITALVPEGTKSFDNYELKQDYTWTFTTIRPRLIEHFPRDQQKWLNLDTEVLLVFNQPIDPGTIKEFVSFIRLDSNNDESMVEFDLDHPDTDQLEKSRIKASQKETILLKSVSPLRPESSYFVELKQGLLGEQGTMGMEKSRIFQFKTFNRFEFEALDVQPDFSPNDSLKLKFTNPVTYKELVSKIVIDPPVQIPDYYFRWEQGESTLWLNLPFEPETDYTLKIPENLEDEFNNKLEKEQSLKFKTTSYPPYISMTTGHGILESYGDLKYPIYAVNTDKISIRAANINKDQLIPLLNQEKVFWSSEELAVEGLFKHTKTIEMPLPRNKREIFPLDLKDYLPLNQGLLLIELDTQLEDKWSRFPKAMLQITNIGISAKFSPENNLIWVTELKTGLPIPEADIEIRNNNNKRLWKGKADSEGKAQSPGWKNLGIKKEDSWTKPQLWVFVSKGNDLAFTSSEWGTGVYPYQLGISYDWNPEPVQIQGYIFSERGIYRAGEHIQIKGIIRKSQKGEWNIPSSQPVECIIQDPFYNQVYK